jgi:hypothetical protein
MYAVLYVETTTILSVSLIHALGIGLRMIGELFYAPIPDMVSILP